MIYKLIDQTGEGFSPKEKQWLICKQEATPERNCTRAFCAVPQWEDRSPADSKADALAVMQALECASNPAAAIGQAMITVEKAGCHSLLTDAVILLGQASAKMDEFARTQQACLLCGHKRENHDPDNITGNCNADQCQCAGFILMR